LDFKSFKDGTTKQLVVNIDPVNDRRQRRDFKEFTSETQGGKFEESGLTWKFGELKPVDSSVMLRRIVPKTDSSQISQTQKRSSREAADQSVHFTHARIELRQNRKMKVRSFENPDGWHDTRFFVLVGIRRDGSVEQLGRSGVLDIKDKLQR